MAPVYFHTEEVKMKISEANKVENNPMYRKHHSLETREKISLALIDNQNCLGIPKSEEHRRKIGLRSIGNKYCLGRVLSEDTKRKISISNKGNLHTEESKRKISDATKGDKNPMFGKHHSKEFKIKLSEFQKGNKYHLGKFHSIESKMKMSEHHKNIHPSEEVRIKIGAALRGKHLSNGHRKKISDAKMGYHPSGEHLRKIINHLKNIRISKPSKPQLKLFEVIKNQYPNFEVVMEQRVNISNRFFLIDVAIPELKLGFEYDAPYWHQDKEKDQYRHNLIESEGWKLIHYQKVFEFGGQN